jgi:hypothetical protein
MKDEFSNRLTAFQTARDTIFSELWRPVWEGKPPVIFGERALEMKTALAGLEEFCRKHGVVITGAAEDKDREETELEDAAFLNAKALVEFYKAAGNGTEAAKYNFPITHWRQLRDGELLREAKSVRLAMEGLASATATQAEAAKYELTTAAATALEKERTDYEKLLTAPAQGISGRKALTGQLRAEFAKVSAKFESLDNLVAKFGTTPLGRDFVATYKAARIIRDAGGGGGAAAGTTTPPN